MVNAHPNRRRHIASAALCVLWTFSPWTVSADVVTGDESPEYATYKLLNSLLAGKKGLAFLLDGKNAIAPRDGYIAGSGSYPWGTDLTRETSKQWPGFWRVVLPALRPSELLAREQEVWTTMAKLNRLGTVSAAGRGIDDRHIAPLVGHEQLRYLNIAGTNVSLKQIKFLVVRTPRLRWLVVGKRMVSDFEAADLAQRFPNLLLHIIPEEFVPAVGQVVLPKSTDDPIAPWLRDDLVARGEFRPEDVDGLVRSYLTVPTPPFSEPQALRQLMLMPDVFVCDFAGFPITDEHMEALVGLGKIVYLGIAGAKVTNKRLNVLQKLRSLRVLHLDEEMLTEETVERLKALRSLRWLTVDCDNLPFVREQQLSEKLPGVFLRPRLKVARDISGDVQTRWDGPDWAFQMVGVGQKGNDGVVHYYRAFQSITSLYVTPLNRGKVPLASLPCLTELKELRWELDEPINDTALNLLAKAVSLEQLEIGPRFRVKSFKPLADLRKIEYLALSCESLADGQMVELCEALARLPKLRTLLFANAMISDRAVRSLEKCSTLRDFLHSDDTKVEIGDEAMFNRLKQLEHFHGDKEFRRNVENKVPPE